MKKIKEKTQKPQLAIFDLIILILSFYVLIALLVDAFVTLDPEVSRMLNLIDNMVCLIFIIDFIRNFRQAPNKLQFLKWGWIDLLASIPNVDFLRAGRLLRVVRLIRIIRAFRSTKLLVDYIFRDKPRGAFTSVSIIAVLLLLFSSVAILLVETDPEANIKTAEDAIWWAFVTLTTTGYGDRYPVTTEGRLIAAVLMVAGVGLFGTFTGYVASWFVGGQGEGKTSQEEN